MNNSSTHQKIQKSSGLVSHQSRLFSVLKNHFRCFSSKWGKVTKVESAQMIDILI